ncbi:MAG: hypothetical protein AAF685_12695 [Cyanobacteria bacterium P01_C01_bin.89]
MSDCVEYIGEIFPALRFAPQPWIVKRFEKDQVHCENANGDMVPKRRELTSVWLSRLCRISEAVKGDRIPINRCHCWNVLLLCFPGVRSGLEFRQRQSHREAHH